MTSRRPLQLTVAIACASLEVLTAAAITVFFAFGLITNQAHDFLVLVSLVGLMLAATVFLAAATKALFDHKRWGRSALIFWQFLQISLGWGSIEGKNGILWLGVSIFLISGITAALLFSKPVSQSFPS